MTKYVNISGGVGIDSEILSKYKPLVLAQFLKMYSELSRKLLILSIFSVRWGKYVLFIL